MVKWVGIKGVIMPNIFKAVFATLLCALVLCGPGGARAADVFTVSGVEVDVTAENAVAAREKAFAEARGEAFRALAERLLGEGEMAHYTPPDQAVISGMIQDFEITSERLSAVRYIATYTFRFDGAAVRNHFNMRGRVYSDVASRPVLVLPFYRLGAGEGSVLWRGENPWLQAWARMTPQGAGALVPLSVPLGDIRDVADIGDDEALAYNTYNLTNMLHRYNAGEAAILIATPGEGGLQVMVYRTDRAVPEFVRTLNVSMQADDDDAALYDRAVLAVRDALQTDWKAQTAIDPAQSAMPATMNVRATFNTMQQWVETRQALRRVQGVEDMRITSVTPREAQIELVFSGDENRLRLALAQAELMLVPRQGYGSAYGGFAPQAYDIYLRKYGGGVGQ